MAEGFLEMSADERERSHLVRQHVEGRLSQREASARLGIGVRQFKRLVRSWRQDDDAGLVSRQRGRPSNHRLSDLRRAEIAALLQGRYAGFGATLASEKLVELDGIKVSTETVRQLQISLGEWKPRPGGRSGCISSVARAASAVRRADPDRRQSARLV
jgi:transposase